MKMDPRTIEWLIGAVFIAIYAFRRYNTPQDMAVQRSLATTTFPRFWSFYVLYVLSLFVLYWFIGSFIRTSPEFLPEKALDGLGLERILAGGGLVVGDTVLNGPITAALMLTTLLPAFPKLQTFDRWLLKKFWDFGHIPFHVYRQGARLARAPFKHTLGLKSEIIKTAEGYDIPASHVVFEESSSLEHEWVRLCGLILQIDTWTRYENLRYARFVEENRAEFDDIRTDFATVSRKIRNYYRRIDQRADAPDDGTSDVLTDLEAHYVDAVRSQVRRTCNFIARGVFAVELTQQNRRRKFAELGFDQDAVVADNLTPNQLTRLAGVIAGTFLVISLLEAALKGGPYYPSSIAFLTVLMATTYGLAAVMGISPKSLWRFADIDESDGRPVFAYVVSAALAVVCGAIAMISIRYTFNAAAGFAPSENVDKVVTALGWSYPYLLQSAAIGGVVAFLADSHHNYRRREPHWLRWRDAAATGAAMCLASALAFAWMEGLGPLEATRDPEYVGRASAVFFLAKGLAVGLVIGLCVPCWHRRNRTGTPKQQLTRLVARRANEIALEAGQLHSDEFGRALAAASAYVATADNTLAAVEREVVRRVLYRLTLRNMVDFAADQAAVDFSVDQAMVAFDDAATRFQRPDARPADEALKDLEPIVGRPALSDLVATLALVVAQEDGIFEDAEQRALGDILQVLNIDPAQYDLAPGAA